MSPRTISELALREPAVLHTKESIEDAVQAVLEAACRRCR